MRKERDIAHQIFAYNHYEDERQMEETTIATNTIKIKSDVDASDEPKTQMTKQEVITEVEMDLPFPIRRTRSSALNTSLKVTDLRLNLKSSSRKKDSSKMMEDDALDAIETDDQPFDITIA